MPGNDADPQPIECSCEMWYKCKCNDIQQWCLVDHPRYFKIFSILALAFALVGTLDAIRHKGVETHKDNSGHKDTVEIHPVNILVDIYIVLITSLMLIIEFGFCEKLNCEEQCGCTVCHCKSWQSEVNTWCRALVAHHGARGLLYLFLGALCLSQGDAGTVLMFLGGLLLAPRGVIGCIFSYSVESKLRDVKAALQAEVLAKKRAGMDFDAIFAEYDYDGTGKIDDVKFETLMEGVLQHPLRGAELTMALKYLDVDGDGSITKDELQEFLFGDDETEDLDVPIVLADGEAGL